MTRALFLAAVAASSLVSVTQAATAKTDHELILATPPGITIEPVGKAHYTPGVVTLATAVQRVENYASAEGLALYVSEKDQEAPGKSLCTGTCAETWPPLIAPANAKTGGIWSTITRDDGRKQWALHGRPLYRYSGDKMIGQDLGRGLEEGNWQLAGFNPAARIATPAGIRIDELPDALGQAFFNSDGRALYAYNGKPGRQPAQCATVICPWRPVEAAALAVPVGDFSIVNRADGTRQWSYQGRALFTYDGDLESGFATGMNVDKDMSVAVAVKYFLPSNATLQYSTSQGHVLADARGKTLYRRDTWAFQQGGHGLRRGVPPRSQVGRAIGASMQGCEAECQKVWHPFLAPDGAQPSGYWQIIVREDGQRQWSYKGYALYTYDGDKRPGDLLGTDYYDFIVSLDPAKEAKYPALSFGMGGLAWLYAYP